MPALLAALALVVSVASPPTITLLLCDSSRSLDADTSALRREVESLVAGAGLEVRWKRVQPGLGFETHDGEMLVVLLPSEMRNEHRERVLGVVIGDHQFPSPIWVSVPNVRAVVGGRGAGAREVQVALGRVVAHEIVHAFLPSRPHAAEGLMGRAVNRATLTAAAGRLDTECLEALARALEDPALRLRVNAPALAALTAAP
jgi:hypothetical protein